MGRPRAAIDVDGVRLTSPDRVLYPEQGITKRELAAYCLAVADRMLPHVAGRPVTLVRCPAGRQKSCFYQRHAAAGAWPGIERIEIAGPGPAATYLSIASRQGLIALVQLGVLEIHPWGARADRPDRPDRIVFDLDPGEGVAFADVVAAAHAVRAALTRAGLASFVMTTGGKGLHVVVPIARRAPVKAFARGVADGLAQEAPDRFLTRVSIAERRGRIFIDTLRNDPSASAVASTTESHAHSIAITRGARRARHAAATLPRARNRGCRRESSRRVGAGPADALDSAQACPAAGVGVAVALTMLAFAGTAERAIRRRAQPRRSGRSRRCVSLRSPSFVGVGMQT